MIHNFSIIIIHVSRVPHRVYFPKNYFVLSIFPSGNNKSGSVHEWDRGGIMGNSNNNNNNSSNNVGSNRTGGGGSSSSSSSSSSNNRVSNNKNNISNNNIININRNDRSSEMIDERSNAGDSSSEERTFSMASGYQGRGRIVNSGNNGSRGRSKNTNSYNRGRGNQRFVSMFSVGFNIFFKSPSCCSLILGHLLKIRHNKNETKETNLFFRQRKLHEIK